MRKENEKLKATLAQKEQELNAGLEKARALEEKVSILKTGSGRMDEQSKKEFEKKINQYIKDIDKVIVHLNG